MAGEVGRNHTAAGQGQQTHDYRNALNFIPGVVQDNFGQIHVAGAQTYQTLTLLDGFNVTQPANGQLLVRVSTDALTIE